MPERQPAPKLSPAPVEISGRPAEWRWQVNRSLCIRGGSPVIRVDNDCVHVDVVPEETAKLQDILGIFFPMESAPKMSRHLPGFLEVEAQDRAALAGDRAQAGEQVRDVGRGAVFKFGEVHEKHGVLRGATELSETVRQVAPDFSDMDQLAPVDCGDKPGFAQFVVKGGGSGAFQQAGESDLGARTQTTKHDFAVAEFEAVAMGGSASVTRRFVLPPIASR